MDSCFDHPELEGRLQWESEKYTLSHPNGFLGSTVLTSAENLKDLYRFVHRTAENDTDDGKKFQHLLIPQGANALESLYWLVKHHQYNAARGRARYLYETYLVLRGLNRDQQRAAKKWNETRNEAHDITNDNQPKPLEVQSQILHNFRKEERKKIRKEDDGEIYSDFWRLLSDRGSHPTSLQGALVDDRHSVTSERSLFMIGLVMTFGITAQYIRTFAGTPTRWELQQRADHILVEAKMAVQPEGLPTFLKDELYFWNPARWTSPFI